MWNGLCFSVAGGRDLMLAMVDMYIGYYLICIISSSYLTVCLPRIERLEDFRRRAAHKRNQAR
jgi:hypothetical protein